MNQDMLYGFALGEPVETGQRFGVDGTTGYVEIPA